MIKIIMVDSKDGKISLTKKELEEMLNEAYNEGYWNGKSHQTITWTTTPYYTWSTSDITGNQTITLGKTNTTTNATENNYTVSVDSDSIKLNDYSNNYNIKGNNINEN